MNVYTPFQWLEELRDFEKLRAQVWVWLRQRKLGRMFDPRGWYPGASNARMERLAAAISDILTVSGPPLMGLALFHACDSFSVRL